MCSVRVSLPQYPTIHTSLETHSTTRESPGCVLFMHFPNRASSAVGQRKAWTRGNVCPIASTLAAIVAPIDIAVRWKKTLKVRSTLTRFSFSGDDKFIQWLRECREAGMQVKGQNNLNISENASSIPKA